MDWGKDAVFSIGASIMRNVALACHLFPHLRRNYVHNWYAKLSIHKFDTRNMNTALYKKRNGPPAPPIYGSGRFLFCAVPDSLIQV